MEIDWSIACRLLSSVWKSEENLRAMVGWFAEMCRRRGLKVKAGKSKVIVLNGEEGLKCW